MSKNDARIKSAAPSQEFVPVDTIRDGVIIMKDGGLRAVLMVSSINFALKNEDEQNAFIMQFQNFLNSLDFSIQISIQSRRLDIRPYLATLEERLKETVDDLMRIQIREYMSFIKNFTDAANIMTKHFFVVIPFTPASISIQSNSGLGAFFGSDKDEKKQIDRTFEENVSQLEQRVSIVQQGLVRSGVRSVQLGTEEATELLYKVFNPGEIDKPMKSGVEY